MRETKGVYSHTTLQKHPYTKNKNNIFPPPPVLNHPCIPPWLAITYTVCVFAKVRADCHILNINSHTK